MCVDDGIASPREPALRKTQRTSMDKLVALEAFVAVAETGGFSKAARQLGVAPSSLTRLLDSLEEQLGTALLTRTTRAVTLTDSGRIYLEQVGPLLSELEQADASISDQGGIAVGPLRVSVPVTFARLFLGPRVHRFLKEHPRVSLDMDLSDSIVDLGGDRVDVAVRIGVPEHQSGLIVRKLSEHQRYVVASPAYLAEHGQPQMPQQLSHHDCMRFSYRQGPQRWTFVRNEECQKVDIKGRLSANSSDILREAVLGGQGIALLAEWLVGEDVSAGTLVRLFPDWKINPLNDEVCVYAAYLPNRRNSRKVQVFIDFLSECTARWVG